jgi:hypothetical protein
MPRYFFNLRDGRYVQDCHGVDLSGPDEVGREAERMRLSVKKFFPSERATLVVTDEQGAVVIELRITS